MSQMYTMSVPVFVKTLGNLSAILDKAAAHAETRKIDPAVLLASRLYPDMFPLIKQIQVACDFAKGTVARLAGQEPPKYDDNETTIDELKARIARTVDYVQGFTPAQFAGAEEREVQMKIRDRTLTFKGQEHKLNIGGVSLGATIGVSKAELIGEVYNLKTPSDIEGTYSAGQASVAVAGGGKVAELKNSKGVVLKVKGKQVGLELALDLSGMEVKLKK